MEATYRNVTLVSLIDELTSALEELAAYPDSEVCKEAADRAIKLLRKGWKEESYPKTFLYFAMLHIAHNVRGATCNRSVKDTGLRVAWMKLGELL